jgi:cell division protein FtsN
VRRHVYQNRYNTTNVAVPKGYRPVWKDDRLNQHRAERTPRPSVVSSTYVAPNGYRAVEREDDRLNPSRGVRTAAGDAQTDQIWQRTIPRSLIPLEQTPPVVTLPEGAVAYSGAAPAPTLFRISTRSAPNVAVAQANPAPTATRSTWVRVATYKTDAEARQVAQSLASQGLPMRLGTVKRSGKAYRVVLAGPFESSQQTQSALSRVRSAGYSNAKIGK